MGTEIANCNLNSVWLRLKTKRKDNRDLSKNIGDVDHKVFVGSIRIAK